ncbi:MAG: 16S rRNA (cytosine(1402)-N(4))-methyltransferase RsmH [Phycisphaeraceae bacterium]
MTPAPPADEGDHRHLPVLADAVLELLAPAPGQIVLDCTLGRGGHAERLIARIAPGGRFVGLDLDPGNLAYARHRLEPAAARADVEMSLVHGDFRDARARLDELGVGHVDALLADLGFASSQMDEPDRGFSFTREGPLDMRLDPDQGTTAGELVNTLDERELADLIYQLGEERLSRRIARKIVERRRESPIQTTSALADLVRQAYGPRGRRMRIHPATRTFMALRIAVNDELGALDALLAALPTLLAPDARAAVISFHSLEDRRVKQAFLRYQQQGDARRLTRKPRTAEDEERDANPRARSAKLRALQWASTPATKARPR